MSLPNNTECGHIEKIWQSVYAYSQAQGLKGYNKHDGLNSPLLRSLLGWGKWPRIVAIQSVMRFPLNIRPLLLVPKTYNPKGLALFARAVLFRYSTTEEDRYLDEAKGILDTLMRLRSAGCSGVAWGYHYPWQDPGFFAPVGTPNAVVTAFVCKAFIHACEITGERSYLDPVRGAIEFFFSDLQVLKDTEDELCLSYMPMPMTMRVMDVSILIGDVIAQYEKLSGDQRFHDRAARLVQYVINRQTEDGAWYYTDPPEQSHITHDNYHTGFILDALWSYMQVHTNKSFLNAYYRGLKFYSDNLFMPDGAPKWMNDKQYPYDVHGAAQGIITFSRHGEEYPRLAEKIATWSDRHLYSGKGYFYYQKNRWFTKRFTLLRWCNGWMCFALANLLFNKAKDEKD